MLLTEYPPVGVCIPLQADDALRFSSWILKNQRRISSLLGKENHICIYLIIIIGFPDKVLGMYILLADEFEEGYGDDVEWEPRKILTF